MSRPSSVCAVDLRRPAKANTCMAFKAAMVACSGVAAWPLIQNSDSWPDVVLPWSPSSALMAAVAACHWRPHGSVADTSLVSRLATSGPAYRMVRSTALNLYSWTNNGLTQGEFFFPGRWLKKKSINGGSAWLSVITSAMSITMVFLLMSLMVNKFCRNFFHVRNASCTYLPTYFLIFFFNFAPFRGFLKN